MQHSYKIQDDPSNQDAFVDDPLLGVQPNYFYQYLDLTQLLSVFEQHMQHQLPGMFLGFEAYGLLYIYQKPVSPEHESVYELWHDQQCLGHLSFYTPDRLSVCVQKHIEKLLALIIGPLNNAIKYEKALINAKIDPLCDLGNRLAYEQVFQESFESAKRYQKPLCLILVDIDRFKIINDTHGHQAGDKVIQKIAEQLQKTCRKGDHLFRLGGDEFAILLNHETELGADLLAERIRLKIQKTNIHFQKQPLKVTVSCGIAHKQAEDTPFELFRRADGALYEAKRHGKNQVKSA